MVLIHFESKNLVKHRLKSYFVLQGLLLICPALRCVLFTRGFRFIINLAWRQESVVY